MKPSTAGRPQLAVSLPDLVARGESLYRRSVFDSATMVFDAGLEDARRTGDLAAEARLLTWLGHAARMRGALDTARRHLEASLALKQARLDSLEAGESWNALGLVALDEDRFLEGRDAFERALRAGGDRKLIAKATGNLGLARAYVGELGEARQALTAMHDSAVALGERRFEANALANLAMLDIWEGRATDALSVLSRARVLYQELRDAPGEQNALGQLAGAYERRGEYGRAFAALDSSLAIARQAGMRGEEAVALRLIAGLHGRVGDHASAVRQFEVAAVAMRALGATVEEASIERSMAEVHLRLGNLGRAREEASLALAAHRTASARLEEVNDLLVLAEVEQRAGSVSVAREHLGLASRLAAASRVPAMVRRVRLYDARLADERKDAARVISLLESDSSGDRAYDLEDAVERDVLVARAWARRGNWVRAAVAGARAIAGLRQVRTGLAVESLQRTLLADRSRIYGDQIGALMQLGRVVDAFSVSDAARSHGLIDDLGIARAAVDTATEGERLLQEVDAIRRVLRTMDDVPPEERSTATRAREDHLARRLEEAHARYEAWVALRTRVPSRRSVLLGQVPGPLAAVHGRLEPDEMLLEYFVMSDSIILFAVSRDSVRAVALQAHAGDVVHRIRVLREIWGTRQRPWQLAREASRALHEDLIAPVRARRWLDGVTRLVIVPHGVLAQLPFAALQDSRTGRWLVQDHEVSYLPSASALAVLRDTPAPSAGTVAFAPFPERLPATLEEARAVAGVKGTMHQGRRATESAVRQELAAGRVVHIATHGVMNARHPLFSRVELERDHTAAASSRNDGHLEVHELLDMRIRSPLVFLAGCETSAFQAWLDDPVRGTDHMTLAQAFLQAGASNVAGTLWRIDDVAAADFATAFHTQLRRGASVRSALAVAQRSMLATTKYQSPYYWASYVLTGAGQTLLADAQNSRP